MASRRWAPIGTVAVAAGVLALLDFVSAGSKTAQRGLISQKPPVYGRFEPGFAKIGVLAIGVAMIAAGIAFVLSRRESTPPWIVMAAGAGIMLALSGSVAVVNGDTKAYTDSLERTRPADYAQDVHVVREVGVRTFIREHPKLMPAFVSVHARTHPPGPVVFFSVLKSLSPKHLIPRAIVIAFLASLVVVPTWFLAVHFFSARAASIAVLLVAVSPAFVIFAFTSMDAVYATVMAGAGAVLFIGVSPRGSPRLSFLGGFAIGLATFMTYGIAMVAAGGAVYGLAVKPLKESWKSLALAGAGLVVALVAMRIVLGFDLAASFRASYRILADESDRSYWYWIFGNPLVWLTFAGLPIAALSVRGTIELRPSFVLALIIPLIALDLNHKFAAETERIGQFAYPFFAAVAAGWLARWEGDRRRPGVVASLVLASALQAILLEALFYTFW